MSDNTVTKPAPELTEEDHRAREIGATYGQEPEEPEIADNGPVPTYNQEETSPAYDERQESSELPEYNEMEEWMRSDDSRNPLG